MLLMRLENSKEEKVKQLKRLKTTLQVVLELKKELEKQDEQIKITPSHSQKRLEVFKQKNLSPAKKLQNQRRLARKLSLTERRQIANEYSKKMNKQTEEENKKKLKLVYVR